MKKIFLLIFLLSGNFAHSMTLEQAQEKARKNFPLLKQKELTKIATEKKLLNYEALYYPDMSLTASALYQSDVTKFPLKLPIPNFSIPTPDKDQYKLLFKVNQLIGTAALYLHLKSLKARKRK